jgi:hypothetical protein
MRNLLIEGIPSAMRRERSQAGLAVFLLVVTAWFIFLLAFQMRLVNRYTCDTYLLLDGGWRILCGQIPYRDFYLASGPLEYVFVAIGLAVTRGTVQSIAVANVAFGVIAAVWCWLLVRKRLHFIPALFVTGWIVLLSSTPSPLGSSFGSISPAMCYNRHGYAFLSLVLIECFLSVRFASFRGGFSSGVAVVLLGFLKANFCAAGILLLCASLPLRRIELKRFSGVLVGSAVALLAGLAWLHMNVTGFIADMRYAAVSRLADLHSISAVRANFILIAISILVSVCRVAMLEPGIGRTRAALHIALLYMSLALSSALLVTTDAFENDYVLLYLWLLLVASAILVERAEGEFKGHATAMIAVCLSVALLIPFTCALTAMDLARDMVGLKKNPGSVLNIPRAAQLHMLESTDYVKWANGAEYAESLNDGMRLLRTYSGQDARIFVLGFHNPFTYLMGRLPARGGSPWMQIGNNFSATVRMDPGRLFGNADVVLLPLFDSKARTSDTIFLEQYGDYLDSHYVRLDASRWWAIYRPR